MKRALLLLLLLSLSGIARAIEPDPPTDLTVYRDALNNQVILRWSSVPGASGYRIYYSTAFDSTYVLLASITTPPYTDVGLAAKKFYYVTSWDGALLTESGPSNRVGYVRFDVPASAAFYQPFGLPFQFWDVVGGVPVYGTESRKPSDIIGIQATPGTLFTADRIIRQGGPYAIRNTAGNWVGALETGPIFMDPGAAYWYLNKHATIPMTVVLAGQVNNANFGTDTIFAPDGFYSRYNPISWRESRVMPRNQLNLLQDGFTGGTGLTSDRVYDQTTGNMFWYRSSDGTWQGPLTAIEPGHAYYIANRHQGHLWLYTYTGSGAP